MPRSKGRPPGRGRPRQPSRQSGGSRGLQRRTHLPASAEVWFDEPVAEDRRSWAMPHGHGTYQEIDLELLDPSDENDLTVLIEAWHTEFEAALDGDQDLVDDGEPFNPRVHVLMHQVVANQLLADDPPVTWQTVQRLAALGYEWHNVMHMIGAVVAEDIHRAITGKRPFDPADYARRLRELPGDWPAPFPSDYR
jgi:Domain of unknown function (DUF1841)